MIVPFVRFEGLACVTLALATIELDFDGATEKDGIDALEKAVSYWVRHTKEGRSLWDASSEDLNIGDLASQAMGEPSFVVALRLHGITHLKVESHALDSGTQSYDRVLVSQDVRDALAEEAPDAAAGAR